MQGLCYWLRRSRMVTARSERDTVRGPSSADMRRLSGGQALNSRACRLQHMCRGQRCWARCEFATTVHRVGSRRWGQLPAVCNWRSAPLDKWAVRLAQQEPWQTRPAPLLAHHVSLAHLPQVRMRAKHARPANTLRRRQVLRAVIVLRDSRRQQAQ